MEKKIIKNQVLEQGYSNVYEKEFIRLDGSIIPVEIRAGLLKDVEGMHFENDYEKNLKISNVVRHAVENSKIIPYFQPIVDNETMKITKFVEAVI